MRIQQIQDKILENNNLIKSLQNQVAQLSRENSDLNIQREDKLIEYFKEYIEIGTSYNVVNRYLYFTGVQTGLKKDDKQYAPNFNDGDSFEFIKKNAKSIVIKCTNKVISSFNNGKRTKIVESNPGWIFRVETLSLYQNLLRDPDFADSYKKYVTRKEALDMLGI
jgi:hypothetical protein